jgi:hypothetical protein
MLTSPNLPPPPPLPAINRWSLMNLNQFPKIYISSQNCNSLNISTLCDKQLKKVQAILNLDTDIIFLCDIRLSTCADNIEKSLSFSCTIKKSNTISCTTRQ